mgnify:FL=1
MILERPKRNNQAFLFSNSVTDYPNQQIDIDTFWGVPLPLHNKSWNYGFIDGHARSYKPQETVGTGTLVLPKGMWTISPGD